MGEGYKGAPVAGGGWGQGVFAHRKRGIAVDVDAFGESNSGRVVLQSLLLGGTQQGGLSGRLKQRKKNYKENATNVLNIERD